MKIGGSGLLHDAGRKKKAVTVFFKSFQDFCSFQGSAAEKFGEDLSLFVSIYLFICLMTVWP